MWILCMLSRSLFLTLSCRSFHRLFDSSAIQSFTALQEKRLIWIRIYSEDDVLQQQKPLDVAELFEVSTCYEYLASADFHDRKLHFLKKKTLLKHFIQVLLQSLEKRLNFKRLDNNLTKTKLVMSYQWKSTISFPDKKIDNKCWEDDTHLTCTNIQKLTLCYTLNHLSWWRTFCYQEYCLKILTQRSSSSLNLTMGYIILSARHQLHSLPVFPIAP